jgi:uncharacterized protein (TIGR02452 family)
MNRTSRAKLAQETVQIVELGTYQSPCGRTVQIGEQVRSCVGGTRYFPPEHLDQLRSDSLQSPAGLPVRIEVANETTLAGAGRVLADGAPSVAALNFASARNPGGGFLGGSQAQEESLARSSALYASLLAAGEFYERHRAASSLLYSDALILSPDCPVFRGDDGALLPQPYAVTFITSAAPNAGAVADNQPEAVAQIPSVLARRAEGVLAVAAAHGCRHLVLGAWGCGVFRNDPGVVAEAFAAHLVRGAWAGRFERVVFSVLDTSPSQATFAAFSEAFAA